MSRIRKPQLDPEDVLEGRARPDARELIALVHEVNPSGRDLPLREAGRRYALKSRLQSLLVRRFGAELVVERVPQQPRLVSLRHRASGVDACHAVLVELEDDARSWVQYQLDIGGPEAAAPKPVPPPPPPRRAPRTTSPQSERPSEALSVAELLAASRAALAAYDYGRARERLEAALERGSDEAGAALVALLVDVLGADGDALALVGRVSPAVLRGGAVRLLLAVAAARVGEREDALARLGDLADDPRAAPVFGALARRALAAHDIRRAEEELGAARDRDPSWADLPTLAAAIEALRSGDRASQEDEARRALAEGRLEDAFARADQLLARFPDSRIAQRIARHREELRRQEHAAALVRAAEESMVAAGLGQARKLILQARAEGIAPGPASAAEGRLSVLEAEQRARAVEAEITEVRSLLEEPSPGDPTPPNAGPRWGHRPQTPGLLAYLALDRPMRAAVRARCPLRELGWLDEIADPELRGKHARSAASAVTALSRAGLALAEDPQAALDLLAPHRKALGASRRADMITQAAQRVLADRRCRAAAGQLRAAEAAFASHVDDGPERAAALLRGVRARELDQVARAEFNELERRVSLLVARRARLREIDKLREENDFLSARARLVELLADTEDPDERATHAAALPEIEEEIRDAYELVVEELPPGTRRRLLGRENADVPRTLSANGEELVLGQSCGEWIFLWSVDVASGALRRRAHFHTNCLVRLQGLVVDAGRLFVVGTTGTVIALDAVSWLPLEDTASTISFGLSTDTTVAPGGKYTWTASGQWGGMSVDVWDGEHDRWVRQNRDLSTEAYVRPLFGMRPAPSQVLGSTAWRAPSIAVLHPFLDKEISLHEAHGPVIAQHRGLWLVANSVVVHPCRETLFAIEVRPRGEELVHMTCELDQRASPFPAITPEAREIPRFHRVGPVQTAVDAPAGLVFVAFDDVLDNPELIAFRVPTAAPSSRGEARPIEPIYRVRIPARTRLVQGVGDGAVAAIVRAEDGFTSTRLGPSPPSWADPPTPSLRTPIPELLRLESAVHCDGYCEARAARVRKDGPILYHEGEANIRARMERARKAGPDAMLDLVAALGVVYRNALRWEAARAAVAAFPEHPEVALLDARLQITAQRWDRVRDTTAALDPTKLSPAQARHRGHLLSHALLMTGEPERALEAAREAVRFEGTCELGMVFALAGEDGERGEDVMPVKAPRTLSEAGEKIAGQLRRMVERADRLREEGELALAIRELDVLVTYDVQEVQSLARLADALLEVDASAEIDPFDQAFALAAFLGAHAETGPYTRVELPLSNPRWDATRLDALATRASAWLAGEDEDERGDEGDETHDDGEEASPPSAAP